MLRVESIDVSIKSVRILRGVRLAADFGFHILPETRQAMKAAAAREGTPRTTVSTV